MSEERAEKARRAYRRVKKALENERAMSDRFLKGSRREAKLAELDDALDGLRILGETIGMVLTEEAEQGGLYESESAGD